MLTKFVSIGSYSPEVRTFGTLITSTKVFSLIIMRLSILCPTTPPTGLGEDRWRFVILASTKAPPLGATLADKSPLIPGIGGGVAVGKWGM